MIGSVLLSLITFVLVGTVAALARARPVRAAARPGSATGFVAVYLLSFAGVVWRRLSGQYGFIAVEGPEGVRIRRGMLQTISETVPYTRIQAVRQVQPILWRPFGWVRLEVDVAGATARNQRGEGTSVVRKAVLPVGSQQDSWHLLARLLGAPDPARTPPPTRARWKAPLSFHFLSAGYDDSHAMCVTGRLNRTTTWVPFEKTQSIRRVQGPLQRPLGLATVHVDVAGKRTRAEFRDREEAEADRLVEELTALSRAARLRRPAGAGAVGAPAAVPPVRMRPKSPATDRHAAAAAAQPPCRPRAGTPTPRDGTNSATGTTAAGPSRSATAAGAASMRLRRCREAHREVVDGADARRVDERVPRLDLVLGDPLVPLAQRHPQLEAGQVRAQAAVDAAAEGDVRVDVAVEAHDVAVGELGLVACWPSRSSP